MKQWLGMVMLLACISFSSATAQDLKNFYKQTLHSEGLLYFVFPQEMPELKKEKKLNVKPLSYDYTYLDSRDSIALLMTCILEPILTPDSLCIHFPSGKQKTYPVELIYCRSAKRGWESRIRCTLDFKDWLLMYQGVAPFVLTLFSTESDLRPSFSDNPRKWSKTTANFTRLQEVIRLNRK